MEHGKVEDSGLNTASGTARFKPSPANAAGAEAAERAAIDWEHEYKLAAQERDAIAKNWVRVWEAARKVLASGVRHTYDCFGTRVSCACGLDDLKEAVKPSPEGVSFQEIRNYTREQFRTIGELQGEVEILRQALDLVTPSHRRPGECWCGIGRDIEGAGHEPGCAFARAHISGVSR